jgi:PAS domain S-box-containing protein
MEPSAAPLPPLSGVAIDTLRAVVSAISDGALILGPDDTIVAMNQGFTDITGFSLDDSPLTPPYPWWPSEEQDPQAYRALLEALADTRDGEETERHLVIYRRDGRRRRIRSSGASVRDDQGRPIARLRIVRDVTRDRDALRRRQTATNTAEQFATADNFPDLVSAAEQGLALLFEGRPVILIDTGAQQVVYTDGRFIDLADVHESDRTALGGEISADTETRRAGVLLIPNQRGSSGASAWVSFSHPRRIGADEMVVADLLAQALSVAVQRIVDAETAAGRLAQLEQAVASHRAIGQAVGILVERHRVRPEEALTRLQKVSQNRNQRVRDIADHIVQTGEEPDGL